MASIRDLKKDIDYLLYEVIADCFAYSEVHPDKNTDEVAKIITDAVELRNDLIARVNNPDGKDNHKIIRAYYKAVQNELLSGTDELFNRLSSLSKTGK
ncbi:MAG TPA: hypothetical protein VJ963_00365 [Bacteroidales bacterium]|nr:hypothetical protein [Bacteroidales bacterium]